MRHLVLAALLLLSCAPAVCAQQIVAHRGASHAAPENTLAAFRLAWEEGADAIEGDFYLTADGEVVCIHDRDTARTCSATLVVAESTLAQLRELEYGAWKHERYRGEPIPTLQEVLAIVPDGKVLLIEVKCGPEIAPALKRILAECGLQAEQIRIIAFNAEVIAACKQVLPKIEGYWLTGHSRDKESGQWSNPIEKVLPTLKRIHADGLDTSVPAEVVNAAFVRELREAHMQFHAWTVDDAATVARLCWLGVDSITTNKPAWLRSVLPQRQLGKHLLVHLSMDRDATVRRKVRDVRSPGVYGSALDLAAGGKPQRIAHSLPDTGTLAFWYKPRGWYDYQTLFDTPAHGNGWEMWIYGNAVLRFRAHPTGSTLSHAFHPGGDRDEWHHIAICWDRKSQANHALSLYVNGHRVDASPWSSRAWFKSGDSFTLGGGHPDNMPGKGAFDEVCLFDTVLDAGEVRFLMGAALPRR